MEATKLVVAEEGAQRRRRPVKKRHPPTNAGDAGCQVVASSADEVSKHGCLTTHSISKIVEGLSPCQKKFLNDTGFSFLVHVKKYRVPLEVAYWLVFNHEVAISKLR